MDRSTESVPVEFRVLGPIEVRNDGLSVEIGGFRQRRLLALLVSRPGGVVETSALAEYVWDDDDRPDNAVEAVRTYVSRLRRSFSDAALDAASLIVTQSPGYRLNIDDAEIDADRFERLVVAARAQLDRGDAVSALVGLDDAIALWRGVPYQEFADQQWIEGEVARLGELYSLAVEQRAAARLDLGAHAEVVGDLEKLVADEPLRARPVELLMLALHRSGRQAEALRAAARFRRAVGDVGLEPSESLAALEARVAAADDGLLPVVASTDTIRGYRLADRIGEGSFSVVYRSVQPSLGREVAVKQIRAELADRPDFIRRFETEAQTVAALEHPHIVPLYDYWREPGSAYLVMRWLRGGTLASRLRRQRLSADESVTLVSQIGSALAAAHHAGVEHRDVRASNVFVDEVGNNYLGDFGIAADAQYVGGRDDTRGLGNLVFEAVTGRSPNGDGDRPPLSTLRPDLPLAAEPVLLRAMLGAGDETYSTVEAFVDDYVTAFDGTARRSVGGTVVPFAEDVVNPYKGLRAFQESDAENFRGRDRLIDRLLHHLASTGAAGRLVAVVGPSGSGKSSLVRAGLIHRLRAGAIAGSDSWFVTTMVPGPRPFDELEAALNRIAIVPTAGLAETMSGSPHGIARAVNSAVPDQESELVVVIDQFEELFTLTDEQTRQCFLDGVVAAVTDPRARVRVVVTIRADHWHRPLQHLDLARLLETATLTVTPMAADELEQAITAPARRMGVAFEPGIVADIVATVHEQPGALPLMQYLLTELFDAREAGLIELDSYRKLGGVAGSLGRRADDVLQHLDADQRAATRRLFARLVTPGHGIDDTRRRVPRSDLATVPTEVIDAFGDARLLTFDHEPSTRASTVEVAHEALLRSWPRLRSWLDEDRSDLLTLHSLSLAAEAWEDAGRDPGDLALGGRLAAATDLAARRPEWLSSSEAAWIASSRSSAEAADVERRRREQRAHQQNRRLRRMLVASVLFLLVAIGAAMTALVSRNAADDARADADIERLVAQSAAAIPTQPDLAILLALEANRQRDDHITQTAVHRAIAADPRIASIHPNPFDQATITTLSDDGSTGVTASVVDGAVAWFDGATGQPLDAAYDASSSISAIAISGNGAVTALAMRTGTIVFVDRDGNELGELGDDDGAPLLEPALDADGDTISVNVGQSPNMRVLDVATGATRSTFALDPDRPVPLVTDLSPDGRRLAVGGSSGGTDQAGSVTIYETSTGDRLHRWDSDRGVVTAIDITIDTVAAGFQDGSIEIRRLSDMEEQPPVSIAAHAGWIESLSLTDANEVISAGSSEVRVWTAEGAPASAPLDVSTEVVSVASGAPGRLTIARRGEGPLVIDPSGGPLIEAVRREAPRSQVWPHSPYYDLPGPDFRSLRLIDLDTGMTVRELDLTDVHPGPVGPPFHSTDGEWLMTFPLGPPSPGRSIAITEIVGDRQFLIEMGDVYGSLFGGARGPGVFTSARPEAGGERLFVLARNDTGEVRAGRFALGGGEQLAGPLTLDFDGFVLPLSDGGAAHGGGLTNAPLGLLRPDLESPPIVVDGSGGLTPFHQDVNSGRIVVGGPGGKLGIVDPNTAMLTPIAGLAGSISGAAFSPDGTLIAAVSREEGVQVFDAETLNPLGIAVEPGPIEPSVAPGIRWTSDASGVWIATQRGPTRIAANPARWVEVACDIVNRELTRDEWATFVSAGGEPIRACTD